MSSLAEREELVGFFSYSRRDDQHSDGALSRLRARIQDELRLQLGRDFRLWQDTAAIPEGALWEDEIKRAIAESVFFIPIVTPSAVSSAHCRFEFNSFLDREVALGRHNLIFPLLYVRVPALEREAEWRRDDVLKIIGIRQYCDWLEFRHRNLREGEVSKKIELYCHNIVEALRQPWTSPEERQAAEQADARRSLEQQQQAEEEEKRRLEADAQARAREAEARASAEAAALSERRAEEQRRARKAEERERQKRETAARRDTENALRQKAKAERLAANAVGAAAGNSWAPIVMPLAAVVLYIVPFAGGMFYSAFERYFFGPLAFGGLCVFLFWYYGRADLRKAVLAGAILWAVSVVLAVEVNLIFVPAVQSMPAAARLLVGVVHGVPVSLMAAFALMGVSAWVCPVLRFHIYWIVALVLWPSISLVTSFAAPVVLTGATANMALAYYFVSFLLKLAVEFACLGFWLSRPDPADKARVQPA